MVATKCYGMLKPHQCVALLVRTLLCGCAIFMLAHLSDSSQSAYIAAVRLRAFVSQSACSLHRPTRVLYPMLLFFVSCAVLQVLARVSIVIFVRPPGSFDSLSSDCSSHIQSFVYNLP
jgi:hypothetical protein